MNSKSCLLLIALSGIAGLSAAQNSGSTRDTVIPASTIEIIQEYRPEVRQAEKPLFTPALPAHNSEKPEFRYSVPQQSLYYSYKSLPLRPLALGRDSIKLPFANYIKAGLGNLKTLYMDAGIGSIRGDNYEMAIHLLHLSQEGNIKYQQSAKTNITIDGAIHDKNYDWQVNADISAERYYQYGYNHDLFPSLEPAKQTLNGGRLTAGLSNKKANEWGISYNPSLTVSHFSGNNISGETTVGFDIPLTKDIDTALRLCFDVNGLFTQLSFDTAKLSNNIFRVGSGLQYHIKRFAANVFVNVAVGQKGNTYLLPDIKLQYSLPDMHMHINAGLKGSLYQNTYEQLFRKNPYISSFPIAQTHSNEIFAGVQKGIGNYIVIMGKVSWSQYQYLPMYLNSLASPGKMIVIYDPKVNALSFEAGARFQVGNYISTGASLAVFNFYKKTYSRIWHEPSLRFNADLVYKPIDRLHITAYATFLDQVYAIDGNNKEVKLKAVFDVGATAEYEFMKRLSAFAAVNNLFNNRYQRWYGYEVYGMNIYGGLRLKF